jgi:hypothetical protein
MLFGLGVYRRYFWSTYLNYYWTASYGASGSVAGSVWTILFSGGAQTLLYPGPNNYSALVRAVRGAK